MKGELKITKTKEIDLSEILLIEGKEENLKYIIANTKSEHISLMNDSTKAHLTIKLNNDKIVGYIILSGLNDENKSIEFRRIVIDEKGKGYGRLTIQKIKNYCFRSLKCHRLWLDVLGSNLRARNLYKSEGFKEEGILKDCLLRENKYESLIIMSMLEDEYEKGSC